ncbi:hypothetical protein MHBO_003213 [Bonamia ostreae]|uniref:Uncharacterized protein n=1 Tax=Bonamia ostreae TaxID=126728 RepID=A0ABV2AQP9_9EUKA
MPEELSAKDNDMIELCTVYEHKKIDETIMTEKSDFWKNNNPFYLAMLYDEEPLRRFFKEFIKKTKK